jgi:hypothetical protein
MEGESKGITIDGPANYAILHIYLLETGIRVVLDCNHENEENEVELFMYKNNQYFRLSSRVLIICRMATGHNYHCILPTLLYLRLPNISMMAPCSCAMEVGA